MLLVFQIIMPLIFVGILIFLNNVVANSSLSVDRVHIHPYNTSERGLFGIVRSSTDAQVFCASLLPLQSSLFQERIRRFHLQLLRARRWH